MAERFIQFGNSGDIFGWDNEDGEPSFMSMDASGLISDGDVLVAGGSGTTADWAAPTGAGLGDVVGPASAADEAFARFDTTTGKLLQNSVVKATNAGAMTGITSLVMSGDLVVDTDTLFVDSAEKRVGIGTAIPSKELEIFSAAPVIRLRDTGATASSTTAFMEFGGTDAGVWTRTGWVGDGSSANTDITLWAEIGDLKLGDSSSNSVLTLSGGDTTLTGDLTVDTNTLFVESSTGRVGIGNLAPSTNLDVTGDIIALTALDPIIEAHSTNGTRFPKLKISHADKDYWIQLNGGTDDLIIYDNTAGAIRFTIDTLGGILIPGDLTVDTNTLFVDSADSKVSIGHLNPTILFDVNAKSGFTSIGGHVIKLTNKTGSVSIEGQLVEVYSSTPVDNAFKLAAANSDGVIGIVYESGVADGSEVWIVVSGIADVRMDGGGSIRGDRLISSVSPGIADVWNVGGAVAIHFQEIGHCLETRVGAGLARAVLHFN